MIRIVNLTCFVIPCCRAGVVFNVLLLFLRDGFLHVAVHLNCFSVAIEGAKVAKDLVNFTFVAGHPADWISAAHVKLLKVQDSELIETLWEAFEVHNFVALQLKLLQLDASLERTDLNDLVVA